MPDDKRLQITFGGDLHELEADTLIESLVSYSFVTDSIYFPIKKLNLVNVLYKV